MEDRDRLIELLVNFRKPDNPITQMAERRIIERIADYLLANGVIVQKQGECIILEEEIGLYSCSICDHKILKEKCNYCPECGAKLKELG